MPRPVAKPQQFDWYFWAICLALIFVVWGVFGQTLHHSFVNVDDDVYVTDNAHVARGLAWPGFKWAFFNLQAGFWQPITWLSLMLDASLYGVRSSGFHFTNVILHTLNTLLLFILLWRLTRLHWQSSFVAALFAIHPLHVESVAWISERKGLLSTFFFLLSILAYVYYARETSAKEMAKRRIFIFYAVSMGLFACALMSKTMVVTLPFLLLLLDYWPLRRWSPTLTRRLLLEKVPYLAMAITAGVLTIRAEKDIGALAEGESLPLNLRFSNAILSTLRYWAQTVWPTDLTVFYPYPGSFHTGWVLLSILVLVFITATVIVKAHRFPHIALGWFWYFVAISPVCGLIQVGGHSRADRYTYIPLIGIFIITAWTLAKLAGLKSRFLAGVIGLSVLIALGMVAHRQTSCWRDSVSLWIHALASAPDNAEARHNLGDAYSAQARWSKATEQYQRALQLKPEHVLAHNALGIALASQGHLDEAIPRFQRAVQLRPSFPVGHYNLSVALASKGLLAEAMAECETAIRLKPDYAEARQNLAAGLAAQGRLQEAAQQFEHALTLATAQGKLELAETIRARLRPVQNALAEQKPR